MTLLITTAVALAVLLLGVVVGLCITAKKADEAIETCIRPAPHICKVNGPCNGWPKETSKQSHLYNK